MGTPRLHKSAPSRINKNQQSCTGGWRIRLFKLAGQQGRTTFRLIGIKDILRIEFHPLSSRWPGWAFYPHGHILTFGPAFGYRHLPIVEPILIAYGLYKLAGDLVSDDDGHADESSEKENE
jgi:hypothetical protein